MNDIEAPKDALHAFAESIRAEDLKEAIEDQEVIQADFEKFRQEMRKAEAALAAATTPGGRQDAAIALESLQGTEGMMRDFLRLADERVIRIKGIRFAHEGQYDEEFAALMAE